MVYEESITWWTVALIVQRESSRAHELENALVTNNHGIICVKAKTVQWAVHLLPTIKPGQLKIIITDTSVDLEWYNLKWSPESIKFLELILKNWIYDSGSTLLLMAYFFHPELYQKQAGLLARPVRIVSTSRVPRANEQMKNMARKLPGTVFEVLTVA